MTSNHTIKSIAVLITVFNRKQKTINCLKALFDQDLPTNIALDVYLTNDGCTDGTPEEVKRLFPQVNIIEGDGSLFWNRGMRKAWEAAEEIKAYDYYLWLNDDTLLSLGAVDRIVNSSIEFANRCIMVGTTLALEDYSYITYGGRTEKGQLIIPQERPIVCNYFNGNIVLIPRHVFNLVGFNDSVFHHALGDYDYGRRARKIGILSYVVPGILGRCDEHEELAIWCNPKYPFKMRKKYFRTPLGQNPKEFFIYDLRHNGIISAILHYFTIHIRLFFPFVWISSKSIK